MATAAPSDALSLFPTGSYVVIEGLKSAPQHNGRYGFVTSHEGDRVGVVTAHAEGLLTIKPVNLQLVTQNRKSKDHEVIMVYPTPTTAGEMCATQAGDMLVSAGDASALNGWPADWKKEMQFLRDTLGWRNPVTLTGITREGIYKSDLVLYFDANSTSLIRNHHAQVSFGKLPAWETKKVNDEMPKRGIRGCCVLVFSPTQAMETLGQTFSDDSLRLESGFKALPNGGKLSLDDASVCLAYQHRRKKNTQAEEDQTDVIERLRNLGHLNEL
jgi:hypothetical protein|tara:strand:+ start:905 stop:1717 length:813 start_codon:yes stop_codon:yes gene_type:complete|mmetsp:Transcript_11109/g.36695  ORF Transcript_11109/g.36695 Transcript_11109/m.36695 type:complete len:271 (+) Transcript_11109:140-952(+)